MGTDCPTKVAATAPVSQKVPCLNAAKSPIETPRVTEIIKAAIFSCADTHIFFFSSSLTVRPRKLEALAEVALDHTFQVPAVLEKGCCR